MVDIAATLEGSQVVTPEQLVSSCLDKVMLKLADSASGEMTAANLTNQILTAYASIRDETIEDNEEGTPDFKAFLGPVILTEELERILLEWLRKSSATSVVNMQVGHTSVSLPKTVLAVRAARVMYAGIMGKDSQEDLRAQIEQMIDFSLFEAQNMHLINEDTAIWLWPIYPQVVDREAVLSRLKIEVVEMLEIIERSENAAVALAKGQASIRQKLIGEIEAWERFSMGIKYNREGGVNAVYERETYKENIGKVMNTVFEFVSKSLVLDKKGHLNIKETLDAIYQEWRNLVKA